MTTTGKAPVTRMYCRRPAWLTSQTVHLRRHLQGYGNAGGSRKAAKTFCVPSATNACHRRNRMLKKDRNRLRELANLERSEGQLNPHVYQEMARLVLLFLDETEKKK